MTDRLTPTQRHYVMSRIHGKGTKPELKVRQWLWKHGYRYRLNVNSVPGKPDIVMRRYRTAIFVNGCFWHGHHVQFSVSSCQLIVNSSCCKIPQTNREFWVNKIKRNQERDQRNYQLLRPWLRKAVPNLIWANVPKVSTWLASSGPMAPLRSSW